MTEKPSWFDPKLSIGNLITIAVVAGGVMAGWYAFDNRLSLLEDRRIQSQLIFDELKGRVTQMERERLDLSGRVIRIEEKISAQTETLGRILRSVERDSWRKNQP